MKLNSVLGILHAIWPGNRHGLFYSSPDPHGADELPMQIFHTFPTLETCHAKYVYLGE